MASYTFFKVASIFATLILFLNLNDCLGIAKFSNMQCLKMDETFLDFTVCRMRAVKRDVNELSINAKLLQEVKANATVRWQLMKKASGYKPFLYDVTIDVCEYLEKRNHPFVNIILNSLVNYTSPVQKCPLPKEISLLHFPFPEKSLQSLPLPVGEYAIFATFGVNGEERAAVKAYFMLTEF